MDNDLIFGTETSDMLTGAGTDDVQIAAVTSTAAPFADALTRPFDAAQVVIPEGENVVRVPVTPGEVVELPFPDDAQFLARIDNGNLAIKVGDVTVILQGYVEAAGQTAPVIEAANGQPLDIATILASTDPNIDIQTAAGPAAGPQGQGADNSGGIFAPFGEGAGLGGFEGAGAQDGTDGLGGGTVDQTGTLFVQFGLLDINLAPIAEDGKRTVDEDHKILDGQVTATDPEGDALTYSLVSGPATGKLTFNADGTWTYDTDGKFESLNTGDHSPVTFTFKANDGTSDSNVATVTIDVTGVNDAPTVTGGTAGFIRSEDSPTINQEIKFIVVDPDDDVSKMTISVDPATLPDGVTFNQATGKITIDTQSHYQYLNAGEHEDFVITFKVTDPHGGSTTRDVTLRVDGANDAAVAFADIVLTNNGTNTFDLPDWTLIANDTDKDTTKDLNVTSLSWLNADLTLGGVATDHVTITDLLPLNATFQYAAGGSGPATVTMTNTAGGDITGTAANEILIGTTGAEKLEGKGGDDIVVGRGGNDEIFGGAGDDTLVFSAGSKIHGETDTVALNGGLAAGADKHGDILAIADVKLDFSDHASVADLDGIETISMQAKVGGAGAQSLTLGAHSVQDLSDHTITPGGVFTSDKDAVRIDGDAVDQLYLSISKDGGNWADTGVEANGYHVYAHETTIGDPTTTDAYVMVSTTVPTASVHLNADAP